jgi:hypothetical protein
VSYILKHGLWLNISSVVWKKNGNNIAVSGNKYVDGNVQQPNLTIKSVDVNDDGTYTFVMVSSITHAHILLMFLTVALHESCTRKAIFWSVTVYN